MLVDPNFPPAEPGRPVLAIAWIVDLAPIALGGAVRVNFFFILVGVGLRFLSPAFLFLALLAALLGGFACVGEKAAALVSADKATGAEIVVAALMAAERPGSFRNRLLASIAPVPAARGFEWLEVTTFVGAAGKKRKRRVVGGGGVLLC